VGKSRPSKAYATDRHNIELSMLYPDNKDNNSNNDYTSVKTTSGGEQGYVSVFYLIHKVITKLRTINIKL